MISYKRFISITLIACLFPFCGISQNLVFNGSFDEANICNEYEAKCAPSAWFYVYATGPGWGYKPNINSSPYAIQLFSARQRDNTRSFWQTMLTQPVEPGYQYRLELDVSPEKGALNLNDIGIVLTKKMYFAIYAAYKIPVDYISFNDAQVTKLANGWYHLSKTCNFADSFQVLVVGNFSPQSNTQILQDRKNKDGFIVTNIDNLSLAPINTGAGVLSFADNKSLSLRDSLYKIRDRHRGLYDLANRKTIIPIENGTTAKKQSARADTLIVPDIAFEFDSYQLIDRPVLVRQLQPAMNGKISKVLVEGFTDSKGSAGYNDTLSTQRAATVASLLTSEFPLVKYVTESRGSGISTKYSDDSKNRRVEIIIYRLQN